jgi:hypothetical protein
LKKDLKNIYKNLKKIDAKTDHYKAMNKYGIENFSIEFLGSYEEKILEEKEVEYINIYHSYIKDNGYNATFGGDGKRYLELDEQEIIEKFNELGLAKEVSKHFNCDSSTILYILHKNNIDINPNKGCDIAKEKCSKPIIQYDTQMNVINTFTSLHDGAKWLKDNSNEIASSLTFIIQKISLCCKKIRKTAYGYIWEFDNK